MTGVSLLGILIFTGGLNLKSESSKIEISLKTIPIHLPSHHNPSYMGSERKESPRVPEKESHRKIRHK